MLKCLQVTSLKVEVQGWGSGAGKRKILRKVNAASAWRHPAEEKFKSPALQNRGQGTQNRRHGLCMRHRRSTAPRPRSPVEQQCRDSLRFPLRKGSGTPLPDHRLEEEQYD